VSNQGLRDRDFVTPKPPGTFRIILLGDSTVFGTDIPLQQTLAKRLEASLVDRVSTVEVVNAGVIGWSPFNELHWLRTRGHELEPDLVVVGFCMNDVVNPRLHWDSTRAVLPAIPDEAIPNLKHDRERVLPVLVSLSPHRRYASSNPSPLSHLRLYSALDSRLRRRAVLDAWNARLEEQRFAVVDGRRWPVYLTLEDTVSIRVLTDPHTPEWAWLRDVYGRLIDECRRSGWRIAVLILPLAYQLEPGYPFLPQQAWREYCERNSVVCVDPLAELSEHDAYDIFLGDRMGNARDIWHLTPFGHDLTGSVLQEHLDRAGMLPSRRLPM
jgi:hypothetical protein